MKENLLSEVVEIEKELARSIENEEIRAREMLDKLRREAARHIAEEEKRLQESVNRALSDSVTRAEKKAAAILERADTTASRLERTGDDVLTTLIRKHILRILP